jgi:hypothetical protein
MDNETMGCKCNSLRHGSCIWRRGQENTHLRRGIRAIMVSIWWLLWAFVMGGYSGMLLISLLLVARRARTRS